MMTDANRTMLDSKTDEKQAPVWQSQLPRVERSVSQLFLILIAIWMIGRIAESSSGHTVFDPWLIKSIGLSAGLMALTAALAWCVQSAVSIAAEYREPKIYPAWLLLAFLALAVVFLLKGYAVAVAGIFAMLSGDTHTAELATFALVKSHPGTPILALNLMFLKFFNGSFDAGLMAPFAWKPSFLLGFFIWSIILGTLLLFQTGLKSAKIIHLALALSGTLLIMHFRAHAEDLTNGAVFLHAAGVSLMIFQLLLIYASLRATLPAGALSLRHLPRGLALGFVAVLLIPALTDLYRQNMEIRKSQHLTQTLPETAGEKEREVILMAPVSVHQGPAYGDAIIGKLPAKTKVIVQEKKYGWVRIGPERWIKDTYLTPSKSTAQRAKTPKTEHSDRS